MGDCCCCKHKFHGDSFSWEDIVSCFDLEACSKVIEDGTIGQNTYDFLLAFCSNLGRISYRFCTTIDFMPNDLDGRL